MKERQLSWGCLSKLEFLINKSTYLEQIYSSYYKNRHFPRIEAQLNKLWSSRIQTLSQKAISTKTEIKSTEGTSFSTFLTHSLPLKERYCDCFILFITIYTIAVVSNAFLTFHTRFVYCDTVYNMHIHKCKL